MTEIRFYHLETQSMEQALPALLTKALQGGKRIVVKSADAAMTEKLNQHLWTYNPDSFLPHGAKSDGFAADQPVWLTAEDENPNGADMLILLQGAESGLLDQFSLCCEIFDGRDENAVQTARTRWKAHKDSGHTLTYWQQTEKGWEKKGE